MIMHTFSLEDPSTSQICLGKPLDRVKHKCPGFEGVVERVLCVDPAGVWESTGKSTIIGVRRRTQPSSASSVASDDDEEPPNSIAPTSAVRQRASRPEDLLATSRPLTDNTDLWEAWTMSLTGEFRTRSLLPDHDDEVDEDAEDELFVVAPGPIARLGKRSVAVGLGNTVKVITLGKEFFDGTVQNGGIGVGVGVGSYRARTKRGPDRKAL